MKIMDALPPSKPRSKTNWEQVVEILRENRGKWACVGTFSVAQASQIRAGNIAAFLPRKGMEPSEKREWMRLNYEVQYRVEETHEKNRCDIYVRFIG